MIAALLFRTLSYVHQLIFMCDVTIFGSFSFCLFVFDSKILCQARASCMALKIAFVGSFKELSGRLNAHDASKSRDKRTFCKTKRDTKKDNRNGMKRKEEQKQNLQLYYERFGNGVDFVLFRENRRKVLRLFAIWSNFSCRWKYHTVFQREKLFEISKMYG